MQSEPKRLIHPRHYLNAPKMSRRDHRQELGAAEQARIMQADSRLRRMLQVCVFGGVACRRAGQP